MYQKDAEILYLIVLASASFLIALKKRNGLNNNLKYHFYLFAGPGDLRTSSLLFGFIAFWIVELD